MPVDAPLFLHKSSWCDILPFYILLQHYTLKFLYNIVKWLSDCSRGFDW
jgi:hypothetical protein